MKTVKTCIANLIATIGYKSAVKAAGVTSQYGMHQAKEPQSLKNLKK